MAINFGIYLEYRRYQPIHGHGIGRTLVFLIQGLIADPNIKVTIAMPGGFKNQMFNFLVDSNIDVNRVEFLSTKVNHFYKLYDLILSIKYKLRPNENIAISKIRVKSDAVGKYITTIAISFFAFFLSGYSIWRLIAFCFFVFLLILLSPLLLLGSSFFLLFKKSNKIIFYLKNKLLVFISAFSRKSNEFIKKVYSNIITKDIKNLIALVNKSEINTWYIPTIFWPETLNIIGNKIYVVPDIIFYEYPLFYNSKNCQSIYEKMQKILKQEHQLICYSNYVKQEHIMRKGFTFENKVKVIKHGNINLKDYLLIDKFFFPDAEYKHNAFRILRQYIKSNISWPYLKNFDFNEANFIFYSSQFRYHKNIFSLIKAFEILLRERFNNIKLILTANIYAEFGDLKEIREYIQKRKLNYDILSLHDLPNNVLAALNALAICAVNPTLFEGGFPFTFTEAYSVGTPSIMSEIPVVLEEIDDMSLRKKMLFNPYDLNDMVEKIEWGIQNRDRLYEIQKPLYQKFLSRSWQVVAAEYLQVYKAVSNHGKQV